MTNWDCCGSPHQKACKGIKLIFSWAQFGLLLVCVEEIVSITLAKAKTKKLMKPWVTIYLTILQYLEKSLFFLAQKKCDWPFCAKGSSRGVTQIYFQPLENLPIVKTVKKSFYFSSRIFSPPFAVAKPSLGDALKFLLEKPHHKHNRGNTALNKKES